MKRLSCLILALVLSFSVVSTLFSTTPAYAENNLPEKHLLLNTDGSYGGSINVELYGEGAPKNGEYDQENSPYFTVNDFYNEKCTNEEYGLTLLPNFKPYQQTMANSSAFACLVMAFNYMGKDVSSNLSELSLVQKYQQDTSKNVKENGVSEMELEGFIQSLNLNIEFDEEIDTALNASLEKYFGDKIIENITKGNIILARYQSGIGYNWYVIIGVDKMGTESALDDILILANPLDANDHYQDGYTTVWLSRFLKWRRFVGKDGTAKPVNQDEMVVIKTGLTPNLQKENRDTSEKEPHYDLHLILNADGSYGGSRDVEKYGSISTKNGSRNVLWSNYYKVNDYYNMGDDGSRLLLEEYRMFQQTMGSSCGLCAMMSIFNYYGEEVDESWEVTLCEAYERFANREVKGTGTTYEFNVKVLTEYGYKATTSHSKRFDEPVFPTYETYRDFMKENLEKDRPVMTSITPRGGHWVVVIGFDDMGTDYIYDDVFILSDSNDVWDHYQDSYNIYSATDFYNVHVNNSLSTIQGMVIMQESPSNGVWPVAVILGAVVGCGVVVALNIIKKKKSKK